MINDDTVYEIGSRVVSSFEYERMIISGYSILSIVHLSKDRILVKYKKNIEIGKDISKKKVLRRIK